MLDVASAAGIERTVLLSVLCERMYSKNSEILRVRPWVQSLADGRIMIDDSPRLPEYLMRYCPLSSFYPRSSDQLYLV